MTAKATATWVGDLHGPYVVTLRLSRAELYETGDIDLFGESSPACTVADAERVLYTTGDGMALPDGLRCVFADDDSRVVLGIVGRPFTRGTTSHAMRETRCYKSGERSGTYGAVTLVIEVTGDLPAHYREHEGHGHEEHPDLAELRSDVAALESTVAVLRAWLCETLVAIDNDPSGWPDYIPAGFACGERVKPAGASGR